MSVLSAEIQVESVEPKSGTSAAGREWKAWFVHATSGAKYATFDAALGSAAFAASGQRAQITYEATEKGNALKSLNVLGSGSAEPVSHQKDNGDVDWDLIGLHKTRCALWAAAIGGGLEVAKAKALVLAAEVDIFHRAPAIQDEDIPF